MPQQGVEIVTSGPLFRNGAAPLRAALHDAVKDIVLAGEAKVKLQLYPGHGVITGTYRRHVRGVMKGSLNGLIHDSKMIYGPWLETGKRRGAQTRFKGYAMFRNAKQQLERIKQKIVNHHVAKAVRSMNGG